MGNSFTAYKILAATACVFCTTPARAQESALPPLNITQHYQVAWGGVPIGRIIFTAKEENGHYSVTVDTKTSGIAKLFSDEKTLAEVSGDGGVHGNYIPRRYISRPQKDGKGKTTALTYDAKGRILTRSRVPDDDPAWRAPVPPADANTATDPITAGLRLRQILFKDVTAQVNSASIRTYEGARLAEMHITVVNAEDSVILEGETVAAVNLRVTRTPLLGYTPKEQK